MRNFGDQMRNFGDQMRNFDAQMRNFNDQLRNSHGFNVGNTGDSEKTDNSLMTIDHLSYKV